MHKELARLGGAQGEVLGIIASLLLSPQVLGRARILGAVGNKSSRSARLAPAADLFLWQFCNPCYHSRHIPTPYTGNRRLPCRSGEGLFFSFT
jgi:hypothetical protein